MKKILCIAALTAICWGAVSQNLTWKPLDPKGEKYDYSGFIKVTDDGYRAIFTIPENKPFHETKFSIFLRDYDGDMVKQDERGLPEGSPAIVSLNGFGDNIVVSGSMDDGAFRKFGKENRLIITDGAGDIKVKEVFPLHGKRHVFTGNPRIHVSSDSTHLIVVNSEQCIPDKPSMKEDRIKRCINIYDQSLKMVWNDTIDYWDLFGEGNGIDDSYYDYIDGKLILVVTNPENKFKKLSASLRVVRFDQPGSHKIILNQKFLLPTVSLSVLNTFDGKICISGINYKDKTRKVVFIIKDLNDDEGAVTKIYNIDKTFTSKYPTYAKYVNEGVTAPDALLKVDDGIVYVSEYGLTYSSSKGGTTYYKKNIAIFKFDNEGGIKWFKMIVKVIASKEAGYEHNCSAFTSGNDVIIFYSDYIDNIKSPTLSMKPKFGVFEDRIWMAAATVDPDGNIKKVPVNHIGSSKTRPIIPNIVQVTPNKFFVTGTQQEAFSKLRYYYSFYTLE